MIADVDLIRRVPALDPASASVITTASDYQDFIDEAWTEIQLRLINLGNRPNLVIGPSALRDVLMYLALALIFENEAAQDNGYLVRAESYRDQYELAWSRLQLTYDSDDDGQPDVKRRAAGASVWLL